VIEQLGSRGKEESQERQSDESTPDKIFQPSESHLLNRLEKEYGLKKRQFNLFEPINSKEIKVDFDQKASVENVKILERSSRNH